MNLKKFVNPYGMGIYTDTTEMLGLRILTSRSGNHDAFYTEYEFTGSNWKQQARAIVPNYLGKSNVIFQILYPFSSSHNINTGHKTEPSVIWLNNANFKLSDIM